MLNRSKGILVLVAAIVVATAGMAQAQTTHALHSSLRIYCCNDWTGNNPTAMAPNPGGGPFVGRPNNALVQGANVNRTVMQNGGNLTVPQSVFGTHFDIIIPNHPAPTVDSVTGSVSIFNRPAILSAGAGPGTFEFCPHDVGPGPGACGSPASATSGPSSVAQNGRISVTAGPNRFGGTMGFLGAGAPSTVNLRNAPVGATLFTAMHFVFPLGGIGNANTTMGKLAFTQYVSTSEFFTTSMHPQFNGTAMQNPAFVSSRMQNGRLTAHAWTTGMVTASHTQLNAPPFQAVTMTGSDNRTPNGNGQLTLVSGNLYQQLGVRTLTRGNTLQMKLPEPTVALSLAGGALVLMGVGIRRRSQGV